MADLNKGDLICCPACEMGLWWIRTDMKDADPLDLWKYINPINSQVPKPISAPSDLFDRTTYLPKCVFCQQNVVTTKIEIMVLQKGLVRLILPNFGII